MFDSAMHELAKAHREVERLLELVDYERRGIRIAQARCARAEAEVVRYRNMSVAQFAEQRELEEEERRRHADAVGNWYDRRGGTIGGGV